MNNFFKSISNKSKEGMKTIDRTNFKIPSPFQIPFELAGFLDAGNLFLNLSKLKNVEKGKGETIIVIPGFGTDEKYTYLLRRYLNETGYNALDWGFGRNNGDVEVLLEKINKLVREKFDADKKKLILVGWSLGGYLAREVARDNQEIISKVITLGSPIVGGPKYTSIGKIFDTKNLTIDELEIEIDKRYNTPLTIPIYSIYSKKDNIVSWEACIDHYSPNVIHLEIISTHIGFMANLDAFINVVKFLQLE